MTRVFVIRPFGIKPDSAGKLIDFNRVHDGLITPALGTFGIAGGTTGDIVEPGNIREDMFKLLVEADLVIADLTIHNANVFYELGIRHALRKKRSILIKGKPVADGPVFDLLTDRYLAYTVDKPEESVVELTEVIRQALASERDTDSPIFKMLPTLPEVEPAAVSQVIPNELIEEIDRARAAHSMGWLRLLAKEVEGLRFEWPALRMIGQAQWDLEDYDGALTTFVRSLKSIQTMSLPTSHWPISTSDDIEKNARKAEINPSSLLHPMLQSLASCRSVRALRPRSAPKRSP